MRSVCTDFECELVEFNGEDNHVHLLVNFPPKVAVTKLVNSLKGVSSRRLRQEFPDLVRHYWRTNKLCPGPTSPGPSEAPRSPWSGSTSSSRTGRCEHRPAPPGPAIAVLRTTGSGHTIPLRRTRTRDAPRRNLRFASPPG